MPEHTAISPQTQNSQAGITAVSPIHEPIKPPAEKETASSSHSFSRLTVGVPDDTDERETDSVANGIMRIQQPSFVQRKCDGCKTEDMIQTKSISNSPLLVQRKLNVVDQGPDNMPANDVAATIPFADKVSHFNTIIQNLCPSFSVNGSGEVFATTNPAPTAATLSSGSNPVGCCGLNVLVNAAKQPDGSEHNWSIKMSQLKGPLTNEQNLEFVLPPANSSIQFGHFRSDDTRGSMNETVVAGHEIIGHGSLIELGIHNDSTGGLGEDREGFNDHDPTIRIQNILAHEQGIPASEDRGLAADGVHRGESFAKTEIKGFAFNSPFVPQAEQGKVALMADYIKANELWVDITGHSDNVGTEAAKQQISDARATAVKNNLINLGVTAIFSKTMPSYSYIQRPRFSSVKGVSDTEPPESADPADARRAIIFATGHPPGMEIPPSDLPQQQEATPGANLEAEKNSEDPCHKLLANSAFPTPAQQPADQQQSNETVQRLPLQRKLSIGAPDDEYEKEADATADRMMRIPEQNFVQRKCAECETGEEIHRKPLSITPFIQAKNEGNASTVSEATAQSIQSSKGAGNAMDENTASFMSSRFGANFSNVKIHSNNKSAQLSRELNAKAFTVGSDIYFNEGQYQPALSSGKTLLAHELTHVVQQNGAGNFVQRMSALDHTDGHNFRSAQVAPFSSTSITGNDYRVYTDRGTEVAAWVAYTGSREQDNSWCHGFSIGTYERWGYSVYSGLDIGNVLRDEYSLLAAHLATPGDIIAWRRAPLDFPHTAILKTLVLSPGGSVDMTRTLMDSKNGNGPIQRNVSLSVMTGRYGSSIEFYRRL